MKQRRKTFLALLCIVALMLGLTACHFESAAPTTEPTDDTIASPVTETTKGTEPTEPSTEPSTEPATEPTTEPATEPAPDPDIQIIEDSVPNEAREVYLAAANFLRDCMENMYLYTEHDVRAHTAAALTPEQMEQLKQQIAEQPDNQAVQNANKRADQIGGELETRAEKFPDFYAEEVNYYRTTRMEQNIRQKNFTARYYLCSEEVMEKPVAKVDGDFAEIFVWESMSYTYTDQVAPTGIGSVYQLWLWNTGEEWVVLDMLNESGINIGRDINHDWEEETRQAVENIRNWD